MRRARPSGWVAQIRAAQQRRPTNQLSKPMTFDPTKPVEDSPLDAAEMRNQLNALQAQITALQQEVAVLPPLLTANITTMALDWIYNGPACDAFHIFVHQPNDAPGTFNDRVQVAGDLRTWATGFDSPADALGYAYYIVPMDGDENPLTLASDTVGFDGAPTPGDLQAQVDALSARVDAQQATIADLQSNVNDLSLQVGDMLASITALQAAVAELQENP